MPESETIGAKEKGRRKNMKNRHTLIPYTLETVARPGSRESRVRRPPEGIVIRHERGGTDEEG